jgi:hypothetical protein
MNRSTSNMHTPLWVKKLLVLYSQTWCAGVQAATWENKTNLLVIFHHTFIGQSQCLGPSDLKPICWDNDEMWQLSSTTHKCNKWNIVQILQKNDFLVTNVEIVGLHTVPVKSLDTPAHSRFFFHFYYFLHCRIIWMTWKLWKNTYRIM